MAVEIRRKTMTKIVRRLATAATLAGLIVAPWTGAVAQMDFPVPGGGGMMGMMGGSCADFVKSGIAITDAQKSAWDAYASALKSTPSGLQAMKDSMMTAISGGKTSVEQLDALIAATESRLKALKELRPTVASLYAALNADQKKKADQMLSSCIQ
jgi:Spy/CpxP family protein refolding chaperone